MCVKVEHRNPYYPEGVFSRFLSFFSGKYCNKVLMIKIDVLLLCFIPYITATNRASLYLVFFLILQVAPLLTTSIRTRHQYAIEIQF